MSLFSDIFVTILSSVVVLTQTGIFWIVLLLHPVSNMNPFHTKIHIYCVQ